MFLPQIIYPKTVLFPHAELNVKKRYSGLIIKGMYYVIRGEEARAERNTARCIAGQN